MCVVAFLVAIDGREGRDRTYHKAIPQQFVRQDQTRVRRLSEAKAEVRVKTAVVSMCKSVDAVNAREFQAWHSIDTFERQESSRAMCLLLSSLRSRATTCRPTAQRSIDFKARRRRLCVGAVALNTVSESQCEKLICSMPPRQ